jgi:hypothetical protein
LGNLRIELSASKHVVSGNTDNYSANSVEWVALLGGQLKALELAKELPEPLQQFPRLGFLVASFEVALEMDDRSPTTAALARDVAARIPGKIRGDPKADWSLWPGSCLPWEFSGVPALTAPP